VQKEKEVLQLRTELDRFKAQNPGDGREAVCMVPPRLLNVTDNIRTSVQRGIVIELSGIL
jgi:hypothetical protein